MCHLAKCHTNNFCDQLSFNLGCFFHVSVFKLSHWNTFLKSKKFCVVSWTWHGFLLSVEQIALIK